MSSEFLLHGVTVESILFDDVLVLVSSLRPDAAVAIAKGSKSLVWETGPVVDTVVDSSFEELTAVLFASFSWTFLLK